jgi:hypothetical protein
MSFGTLSAREQVETPEGRGLRVLFEHTWNSHSALEVPDIEDTMRRINDSRATYLTLTGPYPPILSAALMQYTFSRMSSVFSLHAGGLAFVALCEALMRGDCKVEEVHITNTRATEVDPTLFARAMAANTSLRRMSLRDPTADFSLVAALPVCAALEEITVFVPLDRRVPDETVQAVLGLKQLRFVSGFRNDLAVFQKVWPGCREEVWPESCEARNYHMNRIVVRSA